MKALKFNVNHIAAMLLLGSLGIFTACSKGTTVQEEVELPADGSTTLSFEVSNVGNVVDAGVIPSDDVTPPVSSDLDPVPEGNSARVMRASSKKAVAAVNTSFVPKSAVMVSEPVQLSEDGYDAIVTLTEEDETISSGNSRFINSKLTSNKSGSATVAAAMPSGNKYRVLIYDNNDNYVGTIDATSGTGFTPGFGVYKNTTYKWYAYSYNSSTQVPVPANTANPTITTTADATAMLYDSGTITTVAGSNKINITFEHKLASIAIKVDARGLFTPINSIEGSNATAANLRTGTLNLKTGAYTGTTANSSTNSLLNWTNFAAATGDSVKVAYLYTAGTTAISNFGVTLTDFKVKLDNNTVRTFKNKTFTFSQAFTPQLGKRYTATITLVESAITVGGMKWARENLYYRAGDTGYRFRNQSSNIYQTAADPTSTAEFFNFAAVTSSNGAATAVRDICKLAYPRNTWRLPTDDEQVALASVASSSGSPSRVFGQSSDSRYVAWTYGGTNEYGTNWTSFMGLGYRQQGSNTVENYNTTSTAYGYFWSASYTTGSTNAKYMRVTIDGNQANGYSGSVTANLSTNMRYGMNIRCVRNE